MRLTLQNVVPWGRSRRDYIEMFALSDNDCTGSILDCAGGPSSFNAEATALGTQVVSCDPVYQFSAADIHQRIQETYPKIIAALEDNRDRFVWNNFDSAEHLAQVRLETMARFLDDFPQGKREGRYRVEQLPHLPFADAEFDLALCAHLLFSYSEQFDLDFHIAAVVEMARVAREVRVFPLLTNFAGEISPHLHPLIDQLTQRGYTTRIDTVTYEFQRGGNQMLRVFDPNSSPVKDSAILV